MGREARNTDRSSICAPPRAVAVTLKLSREQQRSFGVISHQTKTPKFSRLGLTLKQQGRIIDIERIKMRE
jgi:hypothetical protein